MLTLDGFTDVSSILSAGVYALVHNGEVVYVGKSRKMLGRVYTHLKMWGDKRSGKVPSWLSAAVKGVLFNEVHICPCRIEDLDRVEREMIERYKPKYNLLHKTDRPVDLPERFRSKGLGIERRA